MAEFVPNFHRETIGPQIRPDLTDLDEEFAGNG
jgi:hypothetical protein